MTTSQVISEYRTSWYGRFGYLTMATAGSIMFASAALVFLPDPSASRQPWPLQLAAGALLVFSGYGVFLFLYRMLGPSRRIATSPRGFVYRGISGSVRIVWADIDSYWLGYGGNSPFLFLHVRLKGSSGNRRKKLKLDVSGLNPGAEQLTEEVLRRTGKKQKRSTTY